MRDWLWIAVAGGAGSVSRHAVAQVAIRLGDAFPWGTLAVNLCGSFLLGVLVECFAKQWVPASVRIGLGVGFLGGFTTFSTFTVETVRLLERGAYGAALANAIGSTLVGVAAAAAGIGAVRLAG